MMLAMILTINAFTMHTAPIYPGVESYFLQYTSKFRPKFPQSFGKYTENVTWNLENKVSTK